MGIRIVSLLYSVQSTNGRLLRDVVRGLDVAIRHRASKVSAMDPGHVRFGSIRYRSDVVVGKLMLIMYVGVWETRERRVPLLPKFCRRGLVTDKCWKFGRRLAH